MSKTTQEVASRELTDDALRSIGSIEDAIKLAAEVNHTAPVVISDVLGNGFEVLPNDQKHKLVDEPFVIVDWRFYQGDKGPGLVVALMVVTRDGRKLIINDGSTGIRQQVESLDKAGARPPILVKGLTRSDYDFADPQTGEVKRATTYYLSTSR